VISDNALLTVAVILFVLSGAWLIASSTQITGYATSVVFGTANLTITSTVDINMTTAIINWGTGTLDGGASAGILDSSNGGKTNASAFTAATNGLVVKNIGNVNVTLTLNASQTAADFIGGTGPAYKWNISNPSGGGCVESGAVLGTYIDVNTTDLGTTICDPLKNIAGADTVRIDIQLTIPKDSRTGALGDILTVRGTSA